MLFPSPLFCMASEQTINIRPPLWLPILAVVIGGAFYLAGKQMEKSPASSVPGTITVTGEGKAFVTPDIASISFGMQTGQQKTAAIAMQKLSENMTKIYEALQNAGIDKKDIATENFWLNPVYNWQTGTQILQGYEANQSLRVKVRDLDKISDVVSVATAAGANQAGSVNFTVDDPEAKRAEARKEAIEQAKEKAQELARQLGVSLGDLKGFSEGYNSGVTPYPTMMRSEGMGGGGDASLPLPSGEQEMSVSVTVTYELN